MRKRTKALLLITPLILLFPLLGLARHEGIYLNMTASLPMGVYKVTPIGAISAPIKADDLVMISDKDLDEIGFDRALCYPYKAVIKRVAATVGDVIDSDGLFVSVNGRRLPHSQIYEKDKFGNRLPTQQYPYTLPHNCLYLTSEHPYGYDSRYLGAIDIKHIKGTARMIFRFPFQKRDYSDIESKR